MTRASFLRNHNPDAPCCGDKSDLLDDKFAKSFKATNVPFVVHMKKKCS